MCACPLPETRKLSKRLYSTSNANPCRSLRVLTAHTSARWTTEQRTVWHTWWRKRNPAHRRSWWRYERVRWIAGGGRRISCVAHLWCDRRTETALGRRRLPDSAPKRVRGVRCAVPHPVHWRANHLPRRLMRWTTDSGTEVTFVAGTSRDLDAKVLKWMFDLTKKNMQALYERIAPSPRCWMRR